VFQINQVIPDLFNFRTIITDLCDGRFVAQEWQATNVGQKPKAFREGGESFVFLVQDKSLNMRPAVIKLAKPAIRENKKLLARFFRGAAIEAQLHELVGGIPDVYETGEFYYIMEYVAGRPLLDYVKSLQSFSYDLIIEILKIIQLMHESGIIHRDIKPDNILVKGAKPYLLDFGLAKQPDNPSQELTRIGEKLGTPLYQTEMLKEDAAKATYADDLQQVGYLIWVIAEKRVPASEDEYTAYLTMLNPCPDWAKYFFGCISGEYKTALQLIKAIETDHKISEKATYTILTAEGLITAIDNVTQQIIKKEVYAI